MEPAEPENPTTPPERPAETDSPAETGGEAPRMMRLDDVLKRAGLVGTGGQAKIWIQDGQVSVNGQVETRRRKQLFLGDCVETMGQQVTLDESFFDC
ncbi:RNA-binding S4 domain-containing protein [Stieleria sp. TO1_6]|uniref:RNA-binding S4 domain-containing protein n=1 Tax=Stieleria tagensis TaxID=2956795 RepID=UPI00209B3D31|nr:RNA-binding S4 domain-containing protein [Stieleria tagensis]MCO8122238.1 RNA-binding S4 domain-containing protein [Stieleria tagensis]